MCVRASVCGQTWTGNPLNVATPLAVKWLRHSNHSEAVIPISLSLSLRWRRRDVGADVSSAQSIVSSTLVWQQLPASEASDVGLSVFRTRQFIGSFQSFLLSFSPCRTVRCSCTLTVVIVGCLFLFYFGRFEYRSFSSTLVHRRLVKYCDALNGSCVDNAVLKIPVAWSGFCLKTAWILWMEPWILCFYTVGWWQEGHPACKNPPSAIFKDSPSKSFGGTRPSKNRHVKQNYRKS